MTASGGQVAEGTEADGLRQFESVRRWLNAICAQGTGSEKTQRLYLASLSYFLSFAKLSPDDLIEVAKGTLHPFP